MALAGEGEATGPLPGRIYVDSSRNEPYTRYETISFDPNTGRWRIEPMPRGPARFLRISPTAKTAAYCRGRDRDEFFTCPLDGSAKEVLVHSDYGAWGLAWAPDGKRLIVTTCAYKLVDRQTVLRMESWLVNADGSAKRRLPIPDTHGVLDWSGDGKFLLTYIPTRTRPHDARQDFQPALYVMATDGTGVRRVTPEGDKASYGRLSPDSASVVYGTGAGPPAGQIGGFSAWKFRVCVVKLDGTGRKEVARENRSGIPAEMCWSPDGRHLAVEYCRWRESWGSISRSVSPEWIDIYDLEGKRIRSIEGPKEEAFGGGAMDWR